MLASSCLVSFAFLWTLFKLKAEDFRLPLFIASLGRGVATFFSLEIVGLFTVGSTLIGEVTSVVKGSFKTVCEVGSFFGIGVFFFSLDLKKEGAIMKLAFFFLPF